MRRFAFFVFALMVLVFASSCEEQYHIGDIGPAGGYIFYDCDADNRHGNSDGLKSKECGWRYLEAAPADITIESTTTFVFGYYRTSSSENNLFVNGSSFLTGTSSATDGKSTGTAIGTGKANTIKLVGKMGSSAYTQSSGSETTANYAAKLCDNYTYGGYSDWFLPSKDELNLMFTQLSLDDLGGFVYDNYWSSSEGSNVVNAWLQHFYNGSQGDSYSRSSNYRVRAVRAF